MKKQKKSTTYLSIIFMAFILIFSACSKEQNETTKPVSHNYVVLIDLSDRLLSPNQDKQDIASILAFFEQFKYNVYRKFIVSSKDRFCIRIIPQEGSPLNADSLNNLLMLDMSAISVKNKKNRIKNYEQLLNPRLQSLYRTARYSKRPSDYRGVDIWRYFNENLQYDLHKKYANHLLILTDGYFDFESYKNTIRKKNRYSSTLFFNYLNRENWKTLAEKKDYGLICIDKKFPPTDVAIIGINPKNNSLNQTDKLIYFWKKWLNEMNFQINMIIKKNNKERIKQILRTNKK